jgi:DNA-directed RNA polymerase subunit beta'
LLKDIDMLAEVPGPVSFGNEIKGSQRPEIKDMDGAKHEFLINRDKQVLVHDGQVVNKGEMIVDGPADPQDILRLLGIEPLARYIADEAHDVYLL